MCKEQRQRRNSRHFKKCAKIQQHLCLGIFLSVKMTSNVPILLQQICHYVNYYCIPLTTHYVALLHTQGRHKSNSRDSAHV